MSEEVKQEGKAKKAEPKVEVKAGVESAKKDKKVEKIDHPSGSFTVTHN